MIQLFQEIKDMPDSTLAKALNELLEWNEKGILKEGICRNLKDKSKNRIPYDAGTLLSLIKKAIFEEVARRWLNEHL